MTAHGDRAPRDLPGARPRARAPLAAVGIGLAVLVAVGVVGWQSRTPGDTGAERVAELASAPPSAAATRIPVRDGALPRAADTEPPVRLRAPALRLDATVTAVGVNPGTGEFDVPPSVDRVGWYRFGPGLEADAGSIVIAGHVDSADQGRGAFFRLGAMSPGDRVTLTGADGDERAFEVVGRERYAKTRIPLDRYFARDGALRVTLITCGGPFDARTRSYRDNVVVTATAVPNG